MKLEILETKLFAEIERDKMETVRRIWLFMDAWGYHVILVAGATSIILLCHSHAAYSSLHLQFGKAIKAEVLAVFTGAITGATFWLTTKLRRLIDRAMRVEPSNDLKG